MEENAENLTPIFADLAEENPNVEEANDPHPVDENPEDHVGDETPDPWDDPTQIDWPNNK